jgi:hypothetical protein
VFCLIISIFFFQHLFQLRFSFLFEASSLPFSHALCSFAQAYLAAGDFSVPFNISQARVNVALAESKAAARAASDARDALPSKAEAVRSKVAGAADGVASNSLNADLLRSMPQAPSP